MHRIKVNFFILACFFYLIINEVKAQTKPYLAEYAKGYRGGFIQNQKSIDGALNFAVIGDWGRGGEYFQKDVATVLAQAVAGINAQFIISTGDNIYPDGVQSTQDPLWNLSFENVFHQYPLHRKWYAVLGNHDYHSNPQAQVDYSKVSARWNMPNRYYSIKQKIGNNAEALFVFIDTNPLSKASYQSAYRDELIKQDSAQQNRWLEKVLSDTSSTIKWKIVVGHHPVYTAGNRALDFPEMKDALEPILEKYKVDFYISGHEHHLQYYQPKGKFTQHLISGAGSEANEGLKPRGPVDYFAPIQGFITFALTESELFAQFINKNGVVIHQLNIPKKH
jgi:predicted phosphodiesterase